MNHLKVKCVYVTFVMALLLCLASSAGLWAQPYAETFVDPEFMDCNNTTGPSTGWHGNAWGGGDASVNSDLDQDGRWGTAVGVPIEDLDGDAVFGTIQWAINNTAVGGIVHLTVPGVYREQLTINTPMTIRAAEGIDVIIEGAHTTCPAGPPGVLPFDGITVAGAGPVILENLTVRGFTIGINAVNTTIVKCRIEDNESVGVFLVTGEIVGSHIVNNTVGLYPGGIVSVSDTVIAESETDGIQIGSDASLAVTGSRIIGNGDQGIQVSTDFGGPDLSVYDSVILRNGNEGIWISGVGVCDLRVSDSKISQNGGDGIFFENSNASINIFSYGAVMGSSIGGNLGDGIEIVGRTMGGPPPVPAGWVELTISESQVALNAGAGLRLTNSTYFCDFGDNSLIRNIGGNEVGHAACSGAMAGRNMLH